MSSLSVVIMELFKNYPGSFISEMDSTHYKNSFLHRKMTVFMRVKGFSLLAAMWPTLSKIDCDSTHL